jgi:hypothetical protein
MALIWRVASKAAREAVLQRRPVKEMLPDGWRLPPDKAPPDDATARELAEWIRSFAEPAPRLL